MTMQTLAHNVDGVTAKKRSHERKPRTGLSLSELQQKLASVSQEMRSHQRDMFRVSREIIDLHYPKKNVIASITPGGGKTLAASISINLLLAAGLVDLVIVVVPNDSLRLQFINGSIKDAWGLTARLTDVDTARLTQRGLFSNDGFVVTVQWLMNNWKALLAAVKGAPLSTRLG